MFSYFRHVVVVGEKVPRICARDLNAVKKGVRGKVSEIRGAPRTRVESVIGGAIPFAVAIGKFNKQIGKKPKAASVFEKRAGIKSDVDIKQSVKGFRADMTFISKPQLVRSFFQIIAREVLKLLHKFN